ncbi:6250_t:CDS:2 [Dentiscutata erythropus]|uniref:6250_t:CDS:1 n=1 Tax=Dentiscutata erythropus TaxID=1348616 RepID=A0A9N9ERU2_9GLOM|nr:6250_t:CDS:2 [Dentiscutata erythropus]
MKKIYFDGHECEDVVEYDKNLNRILPNLDPDEVEIVSVIQDETTLYANDDIKQYWSPKDEYGL